MDNKGACVLVFNSKGELALQLRAAHDDSYPAHWDISAAGGIGANEHPRDAAVRELREELGIETHVEFVGECMCESPQWGTNIVSEQYVYMFKTTYDGAFSPDPNEVETIRFFSLEEISSMVQRGEKFHPEFKALWVDGTIPGAGPYIDKS